MIEIELKIDSLNTKRFYIKGTYIHHREGGPAVELSNGDKFWYQNGQYHRLDGPAHEFADGDKRWYQNGQVHRLDGPAVEWSNGDKLWHINGQKIDCQTQEHFEKSKEYREWKLKVFW